MNRIEIVANGLTLAGLEMAGFLASSSRYDLQEQPMLPCVDVTLLAWGVLFPCSASFGDSWVVTSSSPVSKS